LESIGPGVARKILAGDQASRGANDNCRRKDKAFHSASLLNFLEFGSSIS
jgi:hypothetical protein